MRGEHTKKVTIFLLMLGIINLLADEQPGDNVTIIPKGQSRSFMLTNNHATFYFAETGSENTSSFQGLNVQTYEFLDDYILQVNDKVLSRESAEAWLYSNKLVRKYSEIELEEEVFLIDSLSILVVKLTSKQKLSLSVIPHMGHSKNNRNFVNQWKEDDNCLFIGKRSHMARNEKEDYPVWTGIYVYPTATFIGTDIGGEKVRMVKKNGFVPGKLNFMLDGTGYVFFIVGDDKKDIILQRKKVLKEFNIYLESPGKKINGVRST